MKTIIVAAFASIMAVTSSSVMAQGQGSPAAQAPRSGQGGIQGVVQDAETRAPIASASVAIWKKGVPTIVAGAMTRPDGTFRIEGLTPGLYIAKITMIGYDTHQSAELTISEAAPRAVLGNVALGKSPIALKSVEVNAERDL